MNKVLNGGSRAYELRKQLTKGEMLRETHAHQVAFVEVPAVYFQSVLFMSTLGHHTLIVYSYCDGIACHR